jgi:hypothetical protein
MRNVCYWSAKRLKVGLYYNSRAKKEDERWSNGRPVFKPWIFRIWRDVTRWDSGHYLRQVPLFAEANYGQWRMQFSLLLIKCKDLHYAHGRTGDYAASRRYQIFWCSLWTFSKPDTKTDVLCSAFKCFLRISHQKLQLKCSIYCTKLVTSISIQFYCIIS